MGGLSCAFTASAQAAKQNVSVAKHGILFSEILLGIVPSFDINPQAARKLCASVARTAPRVIVAAAYGKRAASDDRTSREMLQSKITLAIRFPPARARSSIGRATDS